jgi:signal transduction histidine kinase
METTQPDRQITTIMAALPRWTRLGAIWVALGLVALGGVLAWLALALRPPASHLVFLALTLAACAATSFAIGGLVLRLLEARSLSVRVTLAIPALVAAAVIALNIIVAARLMFISVVDSQLLLAFLAFGIFLALALSLSISHRLASALRQMEQGAQRIAAGEYQFRLPTSDLAGPLEVKRMAGWFNHMSESIQDAFARREAAERQRNYLLAALSHDMRTPLATARAMVESIDDGVVSDPATIQRYHRVIRAEMAHLSALIDDVFELSRIASGTLALDCGATQIGDLISDLLEATREQAGRCDVRLTGEVDPGTPLAWADARQIYRVLHNLVQNALRYTPPGGTILVRADRLNDRISISVADSGVGIAPADLELIFEPAFRGEASRSRPIAQPGERAPAGGGFGLAIARGIVVAHGGSIRAQSPLPETLRQTLALPHDASGTLIEFTLPASSPQRSAHA